ncbi:MAG: hypothetical protein FWC77_05095, partial [Defluviitaleaceae bacterium]|nr:hypothetical protein [Defluviitaleaceae bacterium]
GTPIEILQGVATVYTTDTHVIAIGIDGSLWGWSSRWMQHMPWESLAGYWGQSVNVVNQHLPSHLLDSVVSVIGAGNVTYAIQADGSIWALGLGLDGLLQTSAWIHNLSPVNISYGFSFARGGGTPLGLGYVADIPLSFAHNHPLPIMASDPWAHLFIDGEARLWTWYTSQGGLYRTGFIYGMYYDEWDNTPIYLMDSVVYARAGSGAIHALKANGELWFILRGVNEPPTLVADRVAAIFGEWGTYFAVKEDGSLWGWGHNFNNQLGIDGLDHHVLYPTEIMDSVGALYTGSGTAFAHRLDGSLLSWGRNDAGLLGTGHGRVVSPLTDSYNFYPPAEVITDVSVFHLYERSAFAIQNNGYLWAWGDNNAGRLGDGTMANRDTPVKIMDGVAAVYTTGASTFARRADGSLWAWGWNSQGQLGDGTAVSSLSPVRIMGYVRDLYLAPGASFAIRYDNSLWAWGGRFGPTPTRLMDAAHAVYTRNDDMTIHYIRDISGGLWVLDNYHTVPELFMDAVEELFITDSEVFALRESGELWTWGRSRNRDYIRRDKAVRIYFER